MEFLGHNLNDDKRNCASFVLFQVPRGNILNKLKLRLSFRFPSVLVPIARTASLAHYLVPAGPTSHRNQKAFKLAIKLQLATFPSSLFPRFLITWTGPPIWSTQLMTVFITARGQKVGTGECCTALRMIYAKWRFNFLINSIK